MKTLPGTKSCFICGRQNPHGLNLRFETDGNEVQTTFVPGPTHAGFRDTVHGGIIASLLDEVMTWACGVTTKRFAYCGEMTVRFIHPVRIGTACQAVGQLASNRRDKIFEARAQLKDPAGVVLASATGKYLPLKPSESDWMAEDFEAGIEAVNGPTSHSR